MNATDTGCYSAAVAMPGKANGCCVAVTALSGNQICEVQGDDGYTVRNLKQAIERIVNVPPIGQQLTCSDTGELLCDEGQLLRKFVSDVPLRVTLITTPPWSEEDVKGLREEFYNVLNEGEAVMEDVEQCRPRFAAILARMPLYDEDKANVLGMQEPQSSVLVRTLEWLDGDHQVVEMIMDVINGLPTDFQKQLELPALQEDWTVFKHCSDEMRGDRELCTVAVAQDARALEFVRNEEVKGDRNLCLKAVGRRGFALEFVSEELKGDRELCMTALAEDRRALKHASDEMKGDREVCMTAINAGGVFKEEVFAALSRELKNDEAIVLAALDTNEEDTKNDVFAMISEEMQQNNLVRRAAGK